ISTARLVAVGDSGSIFSGNYNYTSVNPPGVTAWTQAASPSIPAGFASDVTSVIYTGQFVALGADGSVLRSGDSITWTSTSATPPAPSIAANGARMNGIALGVSAGALVYVAVGAAGNIFTSTDNLVTWTPVTPPPTPNDLFSVSYVVATGTFIATGANGTLLTSTDALNWALPNSIPAMPNALRGAAFGIGTISAGPFYVVVGDAGTILTSSTGADWTAVAPPLTQDLLGVVFGARFVAVGRGGNVAYSDDGLTWSLSSAGLDDLTAVARAPAMYIAVGAAGANVVSK
ncbi:MAG TPA: hypothetical protein VIW78_08485, partial [Burkholderiales bacterium]